MRNDKKIKMTQFSEIKTHNEHYLFVEKLLQSAFPEEERRDDKQQRAYTDHNQKFHCLLIRDFDKPIGLLTYWDFTDFVYIEHFAIHEKMRNGGYGGQALKAFLQEIGRPVVLEVEMPRVKGDITHRRIAFYRRQGFSLRRMAYKQPPYREGDEWLPMKLMSSGKVKWLKIADMVRDTIYREVYGVS